MLTKVLQCGCPASSILLPITLHTRALNMLTKWQSLCIFWPIALDIFQPFDAHCTKHSAKTTEYIHQQISCGAAWQKRSSQQLWNAIQNEAENSKFPHRVHRCMQFLSEYECRLQWCSWRCQNGLGQICTFHARLCVQLWLILHTPNCGVAWPFGTDSVQAANWEWLGPSNFQWGKPLDFVTCPTPILWRLSDLTRPRSIYCLPIYACWQGSKALLGMYSHHKLCCHEVAWLLRVSARPLAKYGQF